MKNISLYYEKKATKYKIKGKRLKNMIALTAPLKGKKVLDVGCADGTLGKIFQNQGAQVTGVDISRAAIKIAKKKLFDAKVVNISSEKLPFERESFDLVIASEVIEHLFQPRQLLQEINRVLKKDGELVISTPNLLYWANRINFLLGKFKYTQEGVFDESHIHFFTYQTLVEDLRNCGFKIIESNHVYPGSKKLNLLKNCLPSLFAYQILFKAKIN